MPIFIKETTGDQSDHNYQQYIKSKHRDLELQTSIKTHTNTCYHGVQTP